LIGFWKCTINTERRRSWPKHGGHAAYRIVEHGENTEHFHRFAGAMLLAALVPLALRICGDFYVVSMVSKSELLPIALTILLLVFFVGLWFGLPLLPTSVV
jgi:hypothetical protein